MTKKYCDIMFNNAVIFNGKLNNHEDYLKMLGILKNKCKFIGISCVCEFDHELVKEFKNDIMCIEKSNTWWGFVTSYTAVLYYIKSSNELFDYLKKYETFTKYIFGNRNAKIGDEVERTNFGYNDIAFFDENDQLLLKTITHEGDVLVSDSIDKLYNK